VTEGEKWIFYNNPKKKKYYAKPGQSSTSISRPNIHGSKMLCTWWDQKGLVYYELLKPSGFYYGRSVSATIDPFEPCIARKTAGVRAKAYDKVILLHDNARPHVAKVVKKYLKTLKWDVLPYLYSPDTAPSDYWLLQQDATSHRFTSFAEIEN